MSNAGTECLDLEDLAAFADRRLSGAERQRAVEHLADCERCYEIFAEVVSFQEEEATGAGEVVDFPQHEARAGDSARRWLWPAAGTLAAAALVVLVVAPLLRDGDFPPPDAGWDQHGWSVFRSGGPGPLGAEESAFRLGVRTVDLEVALEAGRPGPARSRSAEIVVLLESQETLVPQQLVFGDIRQKLLADMPPADLIDDVEIAEELLRDSVVPRHFYDLGRWAEEGRAAALVGNGRFFSRRATRRFLEDLEGFELHTAVSERLDEVRGLIAGDLAAEDFAAVERALRGIVDGGGVGQPRDS